ncbi:hypothetical protein ANN_07373 [Periplaneta americana]|uniref:Uncharacterized protein n=1 Tax=Periplaneta americana TaxID=6978 RepID=A0ABQ8SZ34_PERAM|nr:hypothetical protein ANN_07373 [Periplaneta americana]
MAGLCEGGNEPPGSLKAMTAFLAKNVEDTGSNLGVGVKLCHLAIGTGCIFPVPKFALFCLTLRRVITR